MKIWHLRGCLILASILSFNLKADYENKAVLIDQYRDATQIRFDHVRNETKEINAIQFIVREDSGGLGYLSELRNAARRGVKVRIIFDDYGSTGASSSRKLTEAMVQHLTEEGIEIKIFHRIDSRKFLQPSRLLKRNHQKIVIFKDSDSFIIGDRNVSGKYFGFSNPKRAGDIKFLSRDLYVHGPETLKVIQHFEESFAHPSAEVLKPKQPIGRDEIEAAKLKLDKAAEMIELRKFVSKKGSVEDWKKKSKPVKSLTFIGDKLDSAEGISQKKLLELISNSKQSAVLETPYLILNKESKRALDNARNNKSAVEIITANSHLTDEKWVPPAADDDLRILSKEGIPVYEYDENRIPHTKSYVIDDKFVYFGSNNFDNRSQNWDLEAGVVIDDTDMAKNLRALIERDKKYSKLMDHNRPSFRSQDCIRWGISQLLRPIL